MNRTRRNHRSKRSHRSRRNRGGAAPIGYSTVSANPQPSERVMQWATTANEGMPPAADMRGVAKGGRRTHKRRKCTCKRSCHCKGKCHCKPHCYCKCHTRCRHKGRSHRK